jgi:hypothetical protein
VDRRTRTYSFVAVLIALASAGVRAEDAPEPKSVPDDAALEAAGAVIGTITIHAASIFDTDDPKENKKLFRAANKLHRTTRDRVILRQLTFAEGDRYSRAALDESERHLRHKRVPLRRRDTAGRLRRHDRRHRRSHARRLDARPAIGFHRSGGANAIHFGLHDANFLGWARASRSRG